MSASKALAFIHEVKQLVIWAQTRISFALAVSLPFCVCGCVTLPGISLPPASCPHPAERNSSRRHGCALVGYGNGAPAETGTVANCFWNRVMKSRCVCISHSWLFIYRNTKFSMLLRGQEWKRCSKSTGNPKLPLH